MTSPKLSSIDEQFLATAQTKLKQAAKADLDNRRAFAQKLLQEAYDAFTRLPRNFTHYEWEQQFDRLHSKLYRGY